MRLTLTISEPERQALLLALAFHSVHRTELDAESSSVTESIVAKLIGPGDKDDDPPGVHWDGRRLFSFYVGILQETKRKHGT